MPNLFSGDVSQWQHYIAGFVSGTPIAIFTAWITVKFALRRFQSERWFDRRLDAYTKVIESLHSMKLCTERQIQAAARGHELSKDTEDELVATYRRGLADLRRLTDMGALIFSPEAIIKLDTLNLELKEASDAAAWWDHLAAEGAAISRCLKELRIIAQRDLNA
jgi:hypothetical protein